MLNEQLVKCTWSTYQLEVKVYSRATDNIKNHTITISFRNLCYLQGGFRIEIETQISQLIALLIYTYIIKIVKLCGGKLLIIVLGLRILKIYHIGLLQYILGLRIFAENIELLHNQYMQLTYFHHMKIAKLYNYNLFVYLF